MMRIILFLAVLLAESAAAADLSWQALRDGALYLYPQDTQQVHISWVPAWQAEANAEQLYLVDGKGRLQDKRVIVASETSGQQ